jgi:DNA repair protein RecN (Recombination protein N)
VLRELSVQNLATIEDARVELEPGFIAWTGETGAGKSLLLTALGLVLGGKASGDLVRAGKSEARAAAVFDLSADPDLRADVEAILGGPLDEDELILTRRITAQGRSQAHANGLPVAVASLRPLSARLIDVHGQREGRALLDPDRQRALLDDFGDLGDPVARYRQARAEHDTLRRRRLALIEAGERRRRERDLLAFERDELAAADPRPGEPDELAREAHRLAHVEELRTATAEAYDHLYESDGSVQERLGRVARRLAPLAESVAELGPIAADIERLAEESRELARQLRRFGQELEDDPERLDDIEARLALYRRLAARFRCTPDELAAKRAEVEAQLAAIDRDESDLAGLDEPLRDAWRRLKSSAEALTTGRQKVARAFAKAVQAQLKALALGEARVTVAIETTPMADDTTAPAPPEDGPDRVEIVFAPNPGEPPRPLRKIASGGELSRVTLAVKTVLAEVDRVPTLVFDEIDTGVGGRLGAVLGRMMANLARGRQIVCVTHLPQLASYATRQWVVRKETERGRTRTTIEPLDEARRVDELAAMIRGASAAEGTRKEALAMLAEAQADR